MPLDGIILAFAGGSALHGAAAPCGGDLDVCGVVIGRPEAELMLENEDPKKRGHLSVSTSPDSEKNTQDDVDIKAYTLRRWAQMALKGNPTAISYLFVPNRIKDMSLEPKEKWECPYDAQQCEYPAASAAAKPTEIPHASGATGKPIPLRPGTGSSCRTGKSSCP